MMNLGNAVRTGPRAHGETTAVVPEALCQASCESIPVTWKDSIAQYTLEDWNLIRTAIEKRLAVNVEETMLLLKAGR